jgi:hypothetical protein
MPQSSPLRILLAWLPAALWAIVIWQLGTDAWSASETSRFLLPVIDWLLPDLEPAMRFRLLATLRKLAHPSVYGVLAALSLYGATRTFGPERIGRRLLLALAPVVVLATADEWRQSGSAVRTGAGLDVGLDVAGGALVVSAALLFSRWRARARRAPGAAP